MAAPAPPVALHGPCSIVFNNTLYVYTPDAFQSIPLEQGGRWRSLPLEAAVTGARCVSVIPSGDASQAALFLVGGSTNVSTMYPGLSYYSFANNRWDSNMPTTSVTQNRRNHASIYLNASSSLLIYAGSQDSSKNTQPSSQTFLIAAEPPYTVTSFPSKAAPPGVNPVLMPWNDTHAALVGGDPNNQRVTLFSPDQGWVDLGVQLPSGIQSQQQAVVVTGSDGSKILETFDFSTSPNTVNSTVLVDPSSNGPSASSIIGAAHSAHSKERRWGPPPAKRRRRDVTAANYPAYNASLAPTTTRSDLALAQDTNGQVVVVGGDSSDPISVFNSQTNAWVDTKQLFRGVASTPSSSRTPTSTPSSSSSPTSSAPSSPTAVAGSDDGKSKSLTILGATLGSIFGLIFLMVLILLMLRYSRRRQRRDAERQSRLGNSGTDRDRLSFADRGASFMTEAGGFVLPAVGDSRGSTTSTAIMGNKYGYGDKHEPTGSYAPTAGESRKPRSSGWSRYFSGLNGNDFAPSASASRGPALSTQFREGDDRSTLGSAAVAPLDVKKELSPDDKNRGRGPSPRGFIGRNGRDYSSDTESSGRSEGFSSGIPPSFNEDNQWTPVARQDWAGAGRASSRDRTASSVYTASRQGSMVPREANAGPLFPRNSSHGSILGSMHPESRAQAASMFHESPGNPPAFPLPPGHAPAGSTPMGPAGAAALPPDRRDLRTAHSDMSWLNLGSSRDESAGG
ncbi:MAG: hypothetical protein M1838_000841 [Thelocarpon superellum]|nr:MAG: hypothetical protein M1838_000841 [Thelocarpon superellum]